MDYSIRVARLDEAQRIVELNEIVQELHYRERPDWFKAPAAALFLPTINEWFQSPLMRLFVAEIGANLVGYSVGVKNDRPDTALTHGMPTVELDQVVVIPEARGAGVGQALCRAVIGWATDEGASRVELGTWAFKRRGIQRLSKRRLLTNRPTDEFDALRPHHTNNVSDFAHACRSRPDPEPERRWRRHRFSTTQRL